MKKDGYRKHYSISCQRCWKRFRPYRSTSKFCSRACAVFGRTGDKRKIPILCKCHECGMEVTRSRKDSALFKYCSKECKGAAQTVNNRGSGNPNYKNAGQKVCVGCSKRFHNYNKLRKFCSVNCAHEYMRGHPMHALKLGLKYEFECMKELVMMGYIVGKTRASKGPYDVFGCNGKEILFVQVKKTNGSNPSKSSWKGLSNLQIPENARKQVWIHTRHNAWKIIDL